MKLAVRYCLIAALFSTVIHAQTGADASKTLSAARTAMGLDKLEVTSFTASGTMTKAQGETSAASDFEMALQLPDKFVKKEQLGSVMGMSVSLTSGFNGSALIYEVEQPQMAGVSVRPLGSGSSPNGRRTPEQQAADDARNLQRGRDDFRRLTLGMFAASFAGAPLEFTPGGQVQSSDGPLDVIVAKGDGFDGKLFIDAKTHRPVAASWMDKEPLVMAPGSGVQRFDSSQSAEDRAAAMAAADKQRQAAEAARKVVEWQMYYTEFKTIDGLTIPTKFTTSVGGKATSELVLNKIKINPKIDVKRFAPKK